MGEQEKIDHVDDDNNVIDQVVRADAHRLGSGTDLFIFGFIVLKVKF